jgi:hypothetical protein
LLQHDYDSLKKLLGESENPNRAEKVACVTLNAKLTMEAVKEVVTGFCGEASPDEKIVGRAEAADRYVVQVQYPELDYAKTRLLQRRIREADIRFVIEDTKTTIRMPANLKAREIVDQLKSRIDAQQKAEISAEKIEITDLSADDRTLFFTSLISKMKGYELRDVTNVKVQSSDKPPKPPTEDEDEDAEEEAEEEASATEQMMAVVENVALKGQALLASAEYQLLKEKGFFITSITWKSIQTESPYNIVEFEAGFEEAELGTGFRYNVRGLYRNREGEFTKTLIPLTSGHKELIFPLIEKTALKELAELRKKVGPATVTANDGGKS